MLEDMDPGNSQLNNGSIIQETQGETAELPASSDVVVNSEPHGNVKTTTGIQESSLCRSPAPSYESMKSDRSMDLPHNFKGDVPHPDDSCVQRVSPVPSCVSEKSDWSLDHPCNFKEGGPHPDSSWLQKESPDCPSPSCVSMKSGKSMDRPMNFKRQTISPELSEFSSSPLTADHARCSMCYSILMDPVSIPCGHSYCKLCINTHWSQPSPTGDYVCLQCKKSYPTRPELSVNVALNWALQALQQTGCGPTCDVCSSKTRPAIKTCVTCDVSYCETHVGDHYTVRGLQQHTLVQIDEDKRLWENGDQREL